MTDFWQEKSKQNTKKLWGFRIQKDSINVLHEIFLKKNPFKRFQNFSQTRKTFFKKIQGKILKGGFQDFSRTPSKKNALFPKVYPKIPLKNHQKVLSKNNPKSPPKIIQSPPKIIQSPPLFTTQITLLQKKISKIFSNKKPFQQENPRIKYGISQKWLKKFLFSLVKKNIPHLKHTTKKPEGFLGALPLSGSPCIYDLPFPLNFVIFGKNYKPKSGCFER